MDKRDQTLCSTNPRLTHSNVTISPEEELFSKPVLFIADKNSLIELSRGLMISTVSYDMDLVEGTVTACLSLNVVYLMFIIWLQ